MKPYSQLSKEELTALKEELEKQFEDVKGKGLKLDMSRGKPSKAQLEIDFVRIISISPFKHLRIIS